MTLQITFSGDEIANYLRVDPTQEVGTINILKSSAMVEAENFLNTDFSVEGVEKEAPATVKEWVLNRIAEKFENRGKAIKPDFSTIKAYRVLSFKSVENLNNNGSDLTETAIINGAD